jgi:hypothetical protein
MHNSGPHRLALPIIISTALTPEIGAATQHHWFRGSCVGHRTLAFWAMEKNRTFVRPGSVVGPQADITFQRGTTAVDDLSQPGRISAGHRQQRALVSRAEYSNNASGDMPAMLVCLRTVARRMHDQASLKSARASFAFRLTSSTVPDRQTRTGSVMGSPSSCPCVQSAPLHQAIASNFVRCPP